ncbi:MAG: helix-turn-helix transcriptional regulator [Clostridia bacterium]|nr:helix-turn-helix transcriptional regulator [Clostridia bacterium]
MPFASQGRKRGQQPFLFWSDVFTLVKGWYQCKDLDRVDLTLLSKICYVLNCELQDILTYVPPEKEQIKKPKQIEKVPSA